MKLRHAPVSLSLAYLILVFAAGCGKKDAAAADTGETIATINGTPITAKEFYDYLVNKNSVIVSTPQGQPQAAQSVGPLGLQALRDMVDRKLILQMAKDEGVMPTDADVQKQLDLQNQLQPGYIDRLTKGGLTMDKIKEETMLELAREKIVTKGVTVPMTEVDQYIKENAKQFSQPAHDSLLMIALKTPANEAAVDKDLASGKSFKDVAKQYSDDPSAKSTGGSVPDTPLDRFPKAWQDALAKTTPMHATDWVPYQGMSFKFYVLGKIPDKPIEMTPVKKEALQKQLAMQRGQLTNDLNAKLLEKLKAAAVDVSLPSLQKPWSQLAEQIKQAPVGPPQGMPPQRMPAPGGPPPKGSKPVPGSTPHF